jgi:hypothetical protein
MTPKSKIEVGIIARLGPGAPPVVIGAVADDALLHHALRRAIAAAERQARVRGEAGGPYLRLGLAPHGPVM